MEQIFLVILDPTLNYAGLSVSRPGVLKAIQGVMLTLFMAPTKRIHIPTLLFIIKNIVIIDNHFVAINNFIYIINIITLRF